jgi:hypothetical protein
MLEHNKSFTNPAVFLSAVSLLALSCGGSQQAAEPPSGALTSPTWSEAESQAPLTVAPIAREPQCSGNDLDANGLARSGLCNIEGHSAPLPQSITASLLTASVSAIAGQSTDVHIVLRNTGAQDVDLYLDHSCGFENLTTKVLRDSQANRLDRVGRKDCPLDAACVGQVAHFTLAPQGKATITLPLPAVVTVIGDSCEELPGRALSPGNYSVEWQTPYTRKPFTTALAVKKLDRLAKGKCKAYASTVAKKAEPDIRLRRGVERELLETCVREQPSQAFADCRMNATTEIELAQCQEVQLPR